MNTRLQLNHGGTRKIEGNKISASFKCQLYDIQIKNLRMELRIRDRPLSPSRSNVYGSRVISTFDATNKQFLVFLYYH